VRTRAGVRRSTPDETGRTVGWRLGAHRGPVPTVWRTRVRHGQQDGRRRENVRTLRTVDGGSGTRGVDGPTRRRRRNLRDRLSPSVTRFGRARASDDEPRRFERGASEGGFAFCSSRLLTSCVYLIRPSRNNLTIVLNMFVTRCWCDRNDCLFDQSVWISESPGRLGGADITNLVCGHTPFVSTRYYLRGAAEQNPIGKPTGSRVVYGPPAPG